MGQCAIAMPDFSSLSALIAAVTGAGAFLVGLAAYIMNRNTEYREYAWRTSEDTFKRARQHLKADMAELQATAQDAQRRHLLVPDIPLLVKPGWIPEIPLALDQVRLEWQPLEESEELSRRSLDVAREKTQRYWPRSRDLKDTYHEVIRRIEVPNPDLFYDGSSFRLLEITTQLPVDDARSGSEGGGPGRVVMRFGPGRYFDALDTTDVIGYETALLSVSASRRAFRRRIDPMRGAYREWLNTPFNLDRRCAIPGVCTLTIRRSNSGSTFILHERNPERVALAQGVTHVTPAGEFQPKNLSATARRSDLNIWANIAREYAEELLGLEQARGQPLDTQSGERYEKAVRTLTAAHTSGAVAVRYLGVGLDPLTWKPEILTVAIFDAAVFDEAFADIVHENDEGRLVFADERMRAGIPFRAEDVRHHSYGRMLTAGQACLRLAWRHRAILGIAD